MLCIFYLVVFGILGIFSASHRKLFFESLECVKNTFARKPCETDVEQKVKTSMTHRVFRRSPRIARLLNRHFRKVSWILIILTVFTGILTLKAAYNLVIHGTCTPGNPGECIIPGGKVPVNATE